MEGTKESFHASLCFTQDRFMVESLVMLPLGVMLGVAGAEGSVSQSLIVVDFVLMRVDMRGRGVAGHRRQYRRCQERDDGRSGEHRESLGSVLQRERLKIDVRLTATARAIHNPTLTRAVIRDCAPPAPHRSIRLAEHGMSI